MQFDSYELIFMFLPTVLAGYFMVDSKLGREGAVIWLVLGSLFFYGWWNPIHLVLLMGSMLVKFRGLKKTALSAS